MAYAPRPWVRRSVDRRRLAAWMPYEGGSNRKWILETLGKRVQPEWNKPEECWDVARPHLRTLVTAMANRFGEIDLYLEFSKKERCDVRCKNARLDDCECSCLGQNHKGAGYMKRWIRVGNNGLVAPAGREIVHLKVRRSKAA
ncbi:hypothetical protein ABN028_19845 [Actinopolymorpha sp. B17G11]|uniref:hypothetical protein n=1 Tax=Actinopolymorpha sp. B17G11 TaxID=3160861 RepID=UPI0032E4591A